MINLFSKYLDLKELVSSFNEDNAISSLNGKTLKPEDQFRYFDSNIPSTESDIKIRISKTWTTIDRSMTIWKPDSW